MRLLLGGRGVTERGSDVLTGWDLCSLGLPYRIVGIVSGAFNQAASKKYDLEYVLASQRVHPGNAITTDTLPTEHGSRFRASTRNWCPARTAP